ncbi:MAG: hypothetical protein U0521_14945 [Anaerolineae bacterium]
MVAGFEAAGYFGWDDEYTDMHITDLPTIITSVTRDGETKQITRYAGDDSAPAPLPYLETWIDLAVGTSQWTGADVSPTSVMSANTPVITLERRASAVPGLAAEHLRRRHRRLPRHRSRRRDRRAGYHD